jgi:hypothetical protein
VKKDYDGYQCSWKAEHNARRAVERNYCTDDIANRPTYAGKTWQDYDRFKAECESREHAIAGVLTKGCEFTGWIPTWTKLGIDNCNCGIDSLGNNRDDLKLVEHDLATT